MFIESGVSQLFHHFVSRISLPLKGLNIVFLPTLKRIEATHTTIYWTVKLFFSIFSLRWGFTLFLYIIMWQKMWRLSSCNWTQYFRNSGNILWFYISLTVEINSTNDFIHIKTRGLVNSIYLHYDRDLSGFLQIKTSSWERK